MEHDNDRPFGIVIFSWVLILSSLVQMTAMFNYKVYVDCYSYWPSWVLVVFYCVSWLEKVLGIVAAVGMLQGKEYGRKVAIVIAIFTLVTLCWKYQYPAYLRHCHLLDEYCAGMFKYIGYPKFSFVRFCLPSLIVHWFLEITFCGLLWYYLTRPSVKKYFSKFYCREKTPAEGRG